MAEDSTQPNTEILLDPDLPPSPGAETAPAEKKKASNYQENEDVALCRAWVQISEDPAIGTHQEGSTFWKRVQKRYKDEIPSPERPFGSLKSRWGVLQKSINKFRACVNQVESFNQSGQSAEDQLNRALRLYSEDQNASFKHLRCYNLLIKCPKWNDYTRDNDKKMDASKKKRARSPSSECPRTTPAPDSTPGPFDAVSDFEGTGSNHTPVERPIGKKRAKLENQLAGKEESWKSDVARAHNILATQSTRQNDIFNNDSESLKLIAQNGSTASQLQIMTQDLSGLDSEQQEFFKLKRSEILTSLREQARNRDQ